MELKKHIQCFDNVVPIHCLQSFLKICNTVNFKKALVGSGRFDEEVRSVLNYNLNNLDNSLTLVHWYNFFKSFIIQNYKKYCLNYSELNHKDFVFQEMEILKYENSNHYTWHADSFVHAPRTVSSILLLNNDYEGGNLLFKDPLTNEIEKITILPNRLIMWPSNFLFPHKVEPVTKGVRFSIVAWIL